MAEFRVVVVEHGYATSRYERDIVTAAGGEFVDAQDLPPADALDLCRDADGILVRRIAVTAEMIATFTRCKVIVRYGVGTDNIDVDAATDAGIIVGHVPDYCIDEVSTHAIALLLDCVRDVAGAHRRMGEGGWQVRRPEAVGRLAGRTLGLVGLGQIGAAVARKLSAWDLRILATDPFIEPELAAALGVRLVDLETLCGESDFLSLHVPLLPETRHLIGRRELELLGPGGILVNTSRGPVADTRAVLAALEEGHLVRAGLDVFEQEPLAADSPLRRHPGVVVTDHMAWYSEQSQADLQTEAARAVATVCTGGLPGSLANPEVLRRLGRYDEWQPAASMLWRLKRARG